MRRIIATLSLTSLMACGGSTADTRSTAATPRADGADSSASVSAASTHVDSASHTRNIVFLGTSLTAGLGVGPDVAFPAVIQTRIDSAGLPFRVTNAGISGETSAGGLRRIDWLLQSPVDVLVVELGANDGLRALNVDSLDHNLDMVLQHTRTKYPGAAIVILGMEAPPNLGKPYTSHFHAVFPALARKYNATLVPFLLAGVAGDRALNQDDGMHPTAEGHRILADNVWRILEPVLVKRTRSYR